MDKMNLYNLFKSVPEGAKKRIGGGRLKGMTDINPMWRIKTLTEAFGPAGRGWGYEVVNKELMNGANGEIAAVVDIVLWYKTDEGVARIPATGGSMFVTKESNGLYTDDECFKKALTDALSVACKALGVGADVYWDKDTTKYTPHKSQQKPAKNESVTANPPKAEKTESVVCNKCGKVIEDYIDANGKRVSASRIADRSMQKYGVVLCLDCIAAVEKAISDMEAEEAAK